ncbi:hypothetical protein CRM22_010596 [Opisthorchis felineus]|uniref:Uncharacterized protein n=1 Tax=Opisthorchis felineus TaxID=147828 RepID=A0A4S2KRK7_OPIFE|nr:hypothetical protein CRM22_010595 [Opisthorchis felineus]TGZ52516.1 hypothetical protein CRM22_010596 [Opisthorchis felineus]
MGTRYYRSADTNALAYTGDDQHAVTPGHQEAVDFFITNVIHLIFSVKEPMRVEDQHSSVLQALFLREQMTEKEQRRLRYFYRLYIKQFIIIEANKRVRGGPSDCRRVSFSISFDHRTEEQKEKHFKVPLSAEQFSEMTQRNCHLRPIMVGLQETIYLNKMENSVMQRLNEDLGIRHLHTRQWRQLFDGRHVLAPLAARVYPPASIEP